LMCSVEGEGDAWNGYGEGKLFKVNFTSLAKCSMIEFRQHHGTSKPKAIAMWIDLLLKYCSYVLDLSNPEPSEVLKGGGDRLEYLFKVILVDSKFWEYYMRHSGKSSSMDAKK
jgi:hypothetical protein